MSACCLSCVPLNTAQLRAPPASRRLAAAGPRRPGQHYSRCTFCAHARYCCGDRVVVYGPPLCLVATIILHVIHHTWVRRTRHTSPLSRSTRTHTLVLWLTCQCCPYVLSLLRSLHFSTILSRVDTSCSMVVERGAQPATAACNSTSTSTGTGRMVGSKSLGTTLVLNFNGVTQTSYLSRVV